VSSTATDADGPAGDGFAEILNPATLKPLGRVALGRQPELDAAVGRARAAAVVLARQSPGERLAALNTAGVAVRAAAEALSTSLSAETGQALWEARDLVGAVAEAWTTAAAAPAGGGGLVIGAVLSADLPLLDLGRQLRVLLAAGHSLICLAPPRAPLAVAALARLLTDLPAGALSVVTGDEVTRTLALGTAGIDAWLDSDGTASGRSDPAVTSLAGRSPTRVIVVTADADVERAAVIIAHSRLYNGGQLALPALRVYAARAVAPALADALHTCVAFLEVGDPTRPGTDLGPLFSAEAALRVEAQVGALLKRRVTLKVGGRRFRPWGLPGHFFQPTVLADVADDDLAAAADIRGPVVTITTMDEPGTTLAREAARSRSVEAMLVSRDPDAVMASLGTIVEIAEPSRARGFAGVLARAGYAPLYGPPAGGMRIAAAEAPGEDRFPYAERPRPGSP
jgi:succinate-semialdehyde dehydrogenase / glutarate-semialdehyde dehydrogenase